MIPDLHVLLHQPVAQAIGWALLQFLWQGTLVGLLTAAALIALRRSAADIRYVVATIGLMLMVTMPVVTAVQAWRASGAAASLGTAAFDTPAAAVRGRITEAVSPRTGNARVASTPRNASNAPATSAIGAIDHRPAAVSPWATSLMLAWLAGVSILSLRLLSGWIVVQRMKTHGTSPAAELWRQVGARLCRQLHIRRPVRFLESRSVDVPTVIGWLRPVVLIPASALAGLAPHQLEAILAHELAHIRRHDYLVNLLQTLVETLLFYHPAVWWLSRRIRIERENCCDDLAVSLCGDPYTYARALAELEELRVGDARQPLVLAVTGGSLLDRVRRLLGTPNHAGRGPGWLAGSAAALVLAGIAVGAVGNELLDRRQERHARRAAARAAQRESLSSEALRAVRSGVKEAAERVADRVPERFARVPDRLARVPERLGRVPERLGRVPDRVFNRLNDSVVEPATAAATTVAREAAARGADAAEIAAAAHAVVADPLPIEATTEQLAEIRRAPRAILGPARTVAAAAAAVIAEAGNALDSMKSGSFLAQGESRGNYSWSDGNQRVEVKYQGAFEFTDDDADVKTLSPNGYLKITEGRWSNRQTVEFTADGSGAITRRYWSGGSERPFDSEGRKWLAEMLPKFIRSSGIGAKARVARIQRTKGTAGVLAEISLISGSWGKRVYFTELIKSDKVDAKAAAQILAQAGREVDSDFELASLLIDSGDRLLLDEASRKAYFEAARSIQSDFEMRRVYSSALKRGSIAPELLAGLLDASVSIESDFEAASLLVQVAETHPLGARTRPAFFRALQGVQSDFEHRRVLTAVAKRPDITAETAAAMVDATTGIDSDFELATVLMGLAQQRPIEGALRDPFFRSVDTLGSSFERGRVLKAVVDRPDVSAETVLAVLRSTAGMGGAFEASQVLMQVATRHAVTGAARDAYIDAAEKLGDFEQSRALAALVKSERRAR